MPARLYLDTARLGLMSSSAQQIQLEFVRFAGEEAGTLYLEKFLRHGFDAWPDHLRNRFPDLSPWRGPNHLAASLNELVGAAPNSRVLVANRSAELMRLAAKLLFQRCQNVLTTDLSWPNYQRILEAEARRSQKKVTWVRLRRQVLLNRVDCHSVVAEIAGEYNRNGCDGLFLPMVDNLGVRLHLDQIVRHVRKDHQVRFIVVDGAQALAQVPVNLAAGYCDLLLAGCHKWLRAYNPMGLMFYGHASSAQRVDRTIREAIKKRSIDDPLLRLTEELSGGTMSRYGETVNLLPLFSCQAAIDDVASGSANLSAKLDHRIANGNRLFTIARESGWKPLAPAECLRSGIALLRPEDRRIASRPPAELRQDFHDHGLAVSTYPHGLVRLSMPSMPWTRPQLQELRAALRSCGVCKRTVAGPKKGQVVYD